MLPTWEWARRLDVLIRSADRFDELCDDAHNPATARKNKVPLPARPRTAVDELIGVTKQANVSAALQSRRSRADRQTLRDLRGVFTAGSKGLHLEDALDHPAPDR